MNIRIIKQRETNLFVEPRKANNGGGYHQPVYEFEYNGKFGSFFDRYRGDFGTDNTVTIDGKHARWGSYLKDREEYSNFDINDPEDVLFAKKFYATFKKHLPLIDKDGEFNWVT